MPQVPALSREQQREGFERSLELRRRRAGIKRDLAADLDDIWEVFEFEDAQGMKVYDLLRALPGIGPKKAAALLEQAGMGRNLTVANSGPRQAARLFRLVCDSKKPRQ